MPATVRNVDLDRYLATHKPSWDRLAELSAQGRRGARRLDVQQIDELVRLYEQTSTNLSHVRTHFRDPGLVAYLTRLVSDAGSVVYGTRARTWRALGRFFTTTFPVAIWQARRHLLVSAVFFFVPAIAAGGWIANSPEARDAAMPPALREAYLNEDFEAYYESERASEFAAEVFTNNAQVAILAFGFGIAFCIPTIVLLVSNGANVGFAAGLFTAYGQQAKFWGLITPHGLLEITGVLIAGAAGLQLGWALIDPGDRPRSVALVESGRRAVVIVIGLILTFLVAGLIEGFVTGQPWPTWLRVGIGATVWLAFSIYLVVCGRAAEKAGYTGALDEDDRRGWTTAV